MPPKTDRMRVGFVLGLTLAIAGSLSGGELPELAPKAPKVFRTQIRPHWLGQEGRFWYRVDRADGEPEFVLVDPREKSVRRFSREDWKPQPETKRGKKRRANDAASPGKRRHSPDGKWEAFVRDHDLWIRDRKTADEFRLSRNGTATNTYHFDATQERAISMKYSRPAEPASMPDVHWSPDSQRLIALQTRVVGERRVHYVEAAPADGLHPKLQSYPYLKAGDPIPEQRPRLFQIAGRKSVAVDNALFKQPWRLTRFRWLRDSSRFTFLYNERGHQALRLIAIDGDTGRVTPIAQESSETFIDYAYKTYLWFAPDESEVLWMSERDGWNHLYRHGLDGELKAHVTTGEWMVRRVLRVDADRRQIWFEAMGIWPEQDPYHAHLARVNFDGSGLTRLTSADGTHEITFAPGGEHFIDKWSRVDLPPVHELRRSTDGDLVCELERADIREWEAAGNEHPIPFVAQGRDGKTDIHGVIHRPWDFDPARKYPVIEYIYAGPHGFFTPKAFRHDYTHRRDLLARGFVVVQMDGMGTNWRGKQFHDVCWKNLGDAGFPDRIAWLRAAAKTRSWMDLDRVGIYGGSAGGQNAMRALIAHSDFYHAAVADCGCHDNRMDKIWWNEAWMGWPVGEEYALSSNVKQAHRMRGELLLMLGGEDRNVDPASTIQVVDALVKSGKDFEFVLQPSRGHGSAESTYGKRRRLDFFLRHLAR